MLEIVFLFEMKTLTYSEPRFLHIKKKMKTVIMMNEVF